MVDAPLPPCEPFAVKFYTEDAGPTLKGNGFDGLRVGEDRQDAEEFIEWLNARLASRDLPPTVVAVLEEAWKYFLSGRDRGDLFAAVAQWDNAGRPGLPKGEKP